MRRYFRRGRGRGRSREPTGWFRQEVSTFNSNAFGVAFSLGVFVPENVTFGAVDTRVTVRRILLEVFPTFTYSASVAQGIITGIGVYMGDEGTSTKDPLLTTEDDQETDWLYLGRYMTLISAGGATLVINPNDPIRGTSFDVWAPSIRAQRKLEQQQSIIVSVNQKRLDAATFAAPTQTRAGMVIDASVLWSRTMRR